MGFVQLGVRWAEVDKIRFYKHFRSCAGLATNIHLFFRFRFWFKGIGVDEKHLSWLLVIIKTAFFDFFQIFSAGNDGWYFGNSESTSNLNKDWDNNTKTAQHWRLSSCSPDPTTNPKTTVWLSNDVPAEILPVFGKIGEVTGKSRQSFQTKEKNIYIFWKI